MGASSSVLGGPGRSRVHGLAVVDGDDELRAAAVAFLRDGVDPGDLLVAALPAEVGARVQDALPSVELVELPAVGVREPEKTAAHLQLVRRAGAEGRRLRLVGQVQESSSRAWDERLRGEAAHDHVFADAAMDTLCLYDRRTTPADVLAATRLAHTEVVVGGTWVANAEHRRPADVVALLGVPVEPVQATTPVLAVDDARSLPDLRHRLAEALRGRLADQDAEEDVHLAASEIAANAFRHGARPVSARVWASADRVVVTIADAGRTFDGLLSGYRPAHGDDLGRGGMGLWLARKLCDHVDLQQTPAGLVVRLTTAVRRQA